MEKFNCLYSKEVSYFFKVFLTFSILFMISPAERSYAAISDTGKIDSLLNGYYSFIKQILNAESCLPHNEAELGELENNSISADFFVPAQLGFWITSAILGTEARLTYPGLTEAYTEVELLSRIDCVFSTIESILTNHAYESTNGKKAFYQAHKVDTGEAVNDAFGLTVSMLDNAYLIVSLTFAKEWLKERDNTLYERSESILDQFDLSMWISSEPISGTGIGFGYTYTVDSLFLGGVNCTVCGAEIDRFTAEARIAPIAALGRGEIDLTTMQELYNKFQISSIPITTNSGITIDLPPYFGTVLETHVPSIFLSVERQSIYAEQTLVPLTEAWEENGLNLGFPDMIMSCMMGINNGFGEYNLFSSSPSEAINSFQNKQVLILPAAAIVAGTTPTLGSRDNLCTIIDYYIEQQGSMPVFGLSNYLEFGSEGLTNPDVQIYGTLEILQAASALYNQVLGGNYIEEVIRQDSSWNIAYDAYAEYLGTYYQKVELEDIFLSSGDGIVKLRGNASNMKTILLKPGDSRIFTLTGIPEGNYQIGLQYSNDGSSDSIQISVNDQVVNSYISVSGGTFGTGWNNMFSSHQLDIGVLQEGENTITFEILAGDNEGVELDAFILKSTNADLAHFAQTPLECEIVSVQGEINRLAIGVSFYPNPATDKLEIYLEEPVSQELSLNVYNILGRIQEISINQIEKGGQQVIMDISNLDSGVYFLELTCNSCSRQVYKFEKIE